MEGLKVLDGRFPKHHTFDAKFNNVQQFEHQLKLQPTLMSHQQKTDLKEISSVHLSQSFKFSTNLSRKELIIIIVIIIMSQQVHFCLLMTPARVAMTLVTQLTLTSNTLTALSKNAHSSAYERECKKSYLIRIQNARALNTKNPSYLNSITKCSTSYSPQPEQEANL